MDSLPPARMPHRRPSLRDVAKAAGVTPASVSYVVNGRTDQVGAETFARIAEAIRAIGYQPQRRGLTLKFNREFAIGLLILDPDPNFLGDPFTTHVASGLGNALVDPGYSLMVTGLRSLQDLEKFLSRPVGVDALAVTVSGSPDMRAAAYRLIDRMTVPIVVVQDHLPPGMRDACAILQDDMDGARALTRHLIERGARSFVFVAPGRAWPAIERREAGIVSELGGRYRLERIECDEQDHAATLQIIENRLSLGALPDAILGGNDQIAIAVLKALARRGIRVGEDVRLTGFNNFIFRNYTTPLLTTVTSQATEIGHKVAETVLARLQAGHFSEREIQFPVSPVFGGTS